MVKENLDKKTKKTAESNNKTKVVAKANKVPKKETTTKATKEADKKKKIKKINEKKENKVKTTKKENAVKPEPTLCVFNKPGQKHITPPKGDGTRGFYESLLEANPKSVIAIVYCVEQGLFGGSKHQELFEAYQELRREGHLKGASGSIRPQAIRYLTKKRK